jgi:hypothetical protein
MHPTRATSLFSASLHRNFSTKQFVRRRIGFHGPHRADCIVIIVSTSPAIEPHQMLAPPSPEPGILGREPSPRKESPGERASAAGPAGRARAGTFQRSGLQNLVSRQKNGQHPPISPPTLPPKSRLPAPPPPTDPPPASW